jgi:hypothetical protein
MLVHPMKEHISKVYHQIQKKRQHKKCAHQKTVTYIIEMQEKYKIKRYDKNTKHYGGK